MPEYLDLDPSGGLSPATDGARRYLADRPGRWRIVPSARDLVVLRRETVGPEAPAVRAVLSGDVSGFGLGEVLAFLAQSRWTGVVTVAQDEVEKSLFLERGAVRWASSNLPADRLGEAVRRLGLVDEGRIEQALAEAGPGVRVGQVLLRRGFLDAAGLYRALRHQVEEIFHSTLLMEHGVFFLFNDPVEGRFAAQIALDLNGLLMDGLRRIDERGRDDATGRVDEPARPVAPAGRPDKPQVREVARVFNTLFREIHEEVARMAPTTGFRLGVEGFLASSHHGAPEVFAGLSLDEEGMIPEEALLENLARAPGGGDPAGRLYEALNELMFFELFQAGEILPPDRDEDLSRRVRLIYELLD